MRPIRSAAFSFFAVILLTSSSLFAPAAHAGTAASIQWNVPCDPPSGVLQDDGQVCALLSLPLDYRDPGGRQISVAVAADAPDGVR